MMVRREIPKASWDGTIMDTTLYFRYPEGSNILNKGLYKNLFVIEEGSGLTPEDASALADLMIYQGDYYFRDRDKNEWVKIILGPIPVIYDNIYLKSEEDALIDDLAFVGPASEWETVEDKEKYLVGKVY